MPTLTQPSPVHFGPRNPCRIPSCPLNEAAIIHGKGIYKHNGETVNRSLQPLVFGDSNPPDFIWKANLAHEEAMAKIKRGLDVKVNWAVAIEMATLVERFCELHAA
ncbi:uncharacterized protein RSE6_12042 [Rhynchosporium secalis]|uniref:Uncharacterized protein n=1 Tax=Rhynchosporium secalis TaxID=38038 RepID=A0A1E1MPG5_RHYSE|nr:uncharacterized protein RSE6_12042 [Rhynchosporium secalis]